MHRSLPRARCCCCCCCCYLLYPPIYPSICLSAPARLGVASLSPSFLLCLPAYCCYLPTYYYCHYSILGLLPSPLLPIHHTPPSTLSLPQPCAPTKSRDRIPPPSHPASAQHASTRRNRPSILTLLHSALLLGLSCTTNRRSGHNLNSPTATAFPPNSHPPPDYSVSRAPATCCCCCCFALLLRCPALSLPASRLPLPAVVHKHFLAAPPTTVSAAARQPARHTRRFALSHRACACCPTHSSRWERTVTCLQPTLPTTLLLRPCMDLSRTSKHQAPLSLPARKVASHFTSYNDRNSTPNTTRATPLGLSADVQVRRQPCPSPSLQTGFSTASCACRS